MNKLLAEILERITPTEEEHRKEDRIVKEIFARLKKKGFKPVLVGSIAKRTDLKGDKDIDLFILFRKSVSRENLEKNGLEIGRQIFKDLKASYEIDYAEHPYIIGSYKGYNVEIVPCYQTRKKMSAVDRTPHHTKYIKRRLKEKPELRDEIRLLKQFMKGSGAYGAEAKIQGFSGYLVELLAINYGSFLNTLLAAKEWNFNQVIDPENLWEDKEALRHFFPEAGLIVIDPIDENRNAAAAVSRQRMAEFILKAREFLGSPGKEFFFPSPRKIPKKENLLRIMKARGTKFLAIRFKHSKINVNSLYSQLRKTERAILQEIKQFQFQAMKSDIWTNEDDLSIILLEFSTWSLPPVERRIGPPLDTDEENQKRFISIHKEYRPYIEDGHLIADVERKFTQVEDLLEEILRERSGFGKEFRKPEKVELLEGKNILRIRGKEFLKFLGMFLGIN